MPCAINIDRDGAGRAPINMERLNFVMRIDEGNAFYRNVYLPDVLGASARQASRRAGFTAAWFGWLQRHGTTASTPRSATATRALTSCKVRRRHHQRRLEQDPIWSICDLEQIQESSPTLAQVRRSETKGSAPWDGVTEPNYVLGAKTKGTRTDIHEIDESAKYSGSRRRAGAAMPWRWGRWRAHPGLCARVARQQVLPARQGAGGLPGQHGQQRHSQALGLPETRVPSSNCCPPPSAARQPLPGRRSTWASCCSKTGTRSWPTIRQATPPRPTSRVGPIHLAQGGQGVGSSAAPRGGLAHWIRIRDGKIDNYQCVVPTTWNGSPRDAKGQIGAFEAALLGTPMVNPEQPLEILRTLHSFDPAWRAPRTSWGRTGRNSPRSGTLTAPTHLGTSMQNEHCCSQGLLTIALVPWAEPPRPM